MPTWLAAQQRPLVTQEVEVIEPGKLLLQLGFEYLQDARFPLAGLEGDLRRIGVMTLHFGVSRAVELQTEGSMRNLLSLSEQRPAFVVPRLSQRGNSTSDVGDFTLAAKVKFFSERGGKPAFGFRFGFEMPNSDERRGIGFNTANVFATLLAQKHFGRLNTFGHLGLGILESPTALFVQNDVLLLGVAGVLSVHNRLNIVGEAQGRKNTRRSQATGALLGIGSRGQVRLGLQIVAGGFRWDVAGIAGLTRDDADRGLTFGVGKSFRLFSGSEADH